MQQSEQQTQEAPLLSGILEQAQEEAVRLLTEAEDQAQKKRTSAEAGRKALLEDARERAAKQRTAILKSADSATSAEVRRITLKSREDLFDKVLNLLRERIRTIAASPEEYTPILTNWLVEAVIGLGTGTALVEASAAERSLITPALLAEAADRVLSLSGAPVTIGLAGESMPAGIGVRVRDGEGNLAFDNRLEARIRRYRRTLIRILSRELTSLEEK